MEIELLVWQISLIAIVAGILIGALGYRFFAPSIKHAEEVQSELDKAREELNKYKADVSQHFDRTAELVNDLAQNYVNVYQHLADGAHTLGASKSFNELYGSGQGNPAIGVTDRSDTIQSGDGDILAESDEKADTPENPADDAGSSSQKVNEEVESDAPKQDDSEPPVPKSPDDPAGAVQLDQDSESLEKVKK